ncbi:MAG: histidine kinase dimerization/phosphoacceptor domain -containing protein, partial [Armatimonadota bacterium]
NKRAIRLGESIAGLAIQKGEVIVVEDVQASEEYIGHDLAVEQGLRSMACIPLVIAGRTVGVLSCYTGEVREFGEDELAALETLANQAAVMIEHAKLQVRNTLMQEMHHRVKNNLQQIASLLRLQLRQSHYKNIEEALNDSLARILAIAAVHELLSRDDLDHVSVKSIAETLGHHMQQSLLMPAKQIAFSVGGDEVFLNTNQATQVALILNEMIANAVEHGFEKRKEGEIHINVEQEGDIVGLWVSNNGEPLPPDFNPEGGQLGLQIVRSLAGALGGKFAISDRLGWTVCEVKFTRQLAE